jgi:hypothetical protein
MKYGTASNFGLYYNLGTGPGTGNDLTSSYYELSGEGSYTFNYRFQIVAAGAVNSTFTGSMEIWHSGSLGTSSLSSQTIQSVLRENYYDGILSTIPNNYPGVFVNEVPSDNITLLNGFTLYNFDGISSSPISQETLLSDTLYRAYNYFYVTTVPTNDSPGSNPTIGIIDDNGNFAIQIFLGRFFVKDGLNPLLSNTPKYSSIQGPFTVPEDQILSFQGSETIEIDQVNFNIGDKIGFRFFVESTGNITEVSLIRRGALLEAIPSNNTLVVEPSDVCVDQNSNSFYLSPELSPFFNNSYIFNPLDSIVSSSYANLVLEYGDILYPFLLQENDKIIIQIIDENGPFVEYTVNNVIYTVGQTGNELVYINVKEDISGYFGDACNKFFKIVFLKRINDETNIIINLTKPEGKTSYGFVIPGNIAQNVLNNIDAITTNTKQQLIDAGIDITQ